MDFFQAVTFLNYRFIEFYNNTNVGKLTSLAVQQITMMYGNLDVDVHGDNW